MGSFAQAERAYLGEFERHDEAQFVRGERIQKYIDDNLEDAVEVAKALQRQETDGAQIVCDILELLPEIDAHKTGREERMERLLNICKRLETELTEHFFRLAERAV